MASARGKTTIDLIQALQEKPFGFDFFRAVRLLEARRALCRALELVVLGDMAALGQTTGSVSLRHGVEHSAGRIPAGTT